MASSNRHGLVSHEEFTSTFATALEGYGAQDFKKTIQDFKELAGWIRLEKQKMPAKGCKHWREWHASTVNRLARTASHTKKDPIANTRAGLAKTAGHTVLDGSRRKSVGVNGPDLSNEEEGLLTRLGRLESALDSGPSGLGGSRSQDSRNQNSRNQDSRNQDSRNRGSDALLNRLESSRFQSPTQDANLLEARLLEDDEGEEAGTTMLPPEQDLNLKAPIANTRAVNLKAPIANTRAGLSKVVTSKRKSSLNSLVDKPGRGEAILTTNPS